MKSKQYSAGPLRANLKILLVFAAVLIAVLTLSRLLLVAWQWQRVVDAGTLQSVFVQGLRFDVVLLGMFLAVLALLFPVLASNQRLLPVWRLFLRTFLPAALLVALFMEISTVSFIEQFDARPNILFFEYLNHPREVGATLWAAYKLPLLLAVLGVGGGAIVTTRIFRRMAANVTPTGVLRSLLVTPVLLIVCLGMIRSTTDHRPVNPSTVALSGDPLVNELALSSTYTALYALYETRHESEGGFRYAELDDNEVVADIRDDMWVAREDFVSASLPTLHRQRPGPDTGMPKNLVIIVEESLGAEFVGALGGLDLTPNLDALARHGLWFENLYATGMRSVRGLEAIVSGFTPTPARSVVKLPKSQRDFFTLASLLQREGYSTSFIYGGEAQFDNMRRFFVNNGFERIIDEKDYEDPVYTGSWGVSDEDLFERAHEEFSTAEERPFFSLVFTSSNHSPFEYPDGRIEPRGEDKNSVENAVRYADYALGRFVAKARQSEYWDDTVFLIVADHNSRVYGSELVPVQRFHIPGLVLGGSIAPDTFEPVASQIDLGPTLLSLIGVASEHPMIGHDLTQAAARENPGRAIMQFNGSQAYMIGNRVAVLQKDLPVRQFVYEDGRLVDAEEQDPALAEQALAHAAWSSMAYEKGLYRLPPATERYAQHVVVETDSNGS